MNRSMRFPSLSVVALLALAFGSAAPAAADDAMAGPGMDCSKAEAMLMAPMKSGSSMHDMKPTGNVDADYAQMMMMHHQGMMMMAKVEVACGKDAKTKALAQKQLDQATADDAILQDILKNASKI